MGTLCSFHRCCLAQPCLHNPHPMFLPLALPQAHSSAAHPHCAFCRRTFYDDDGEWQRVGPGHPSMRAMLLQYSKARITCS